ncbi:enoyl-CoA hydratase/isomerase family protein [Denitrificimonas caeni]|uniref:enoyl-CoA hydratase/isomerase family protein n=1 Tax=Denitrificimonas caeni TaxID=521720 RepID=UPI0019630C35|nr:enoyl-CoA hydratase-related protein [Denitrificimonas caeni]
MNASQSANILLERRGNIALITLNRPAARNALDLQSMQQLLQIARTLAADSQLKGVLLLGQSGYFCAGGDVHYFQQLCSLPEAQRLPLLHDYIATAQDVIRVLAALPCPLIACVDGAAAGFGLSLACLADQVITSQRSRLLPAYTAIAASPDGGLSYLLTQLIGERRALQWILHNHPMPLEQALEWGLISELQSNEDFTQRLDALIQTLAASPACAFRNSKRLIKHTSLSALDRQLTEELQAFINSAMHPDFAEGIAAFSEKRAASFAQ